MSILIKGMEIPKFCNACPMNMYEGQDGYLCRVLPGIKYYDELKPWKKKRKDCPLIEVPDSHGDLIDRDALIDAMFENLVEKTMIFGGQYVYTKTEIENAPTIIPASKGET